MERRHWLKLCVLAAAAPSRAWADAQEIAVIVNPAREESRLGADTLEAIFRTEMKTWPSGGKIVPFNFPARHSVRVAFDRAVLHMSPDEVARFWIDRRVRGGERPPRQVESTELMMKVIAKLEGGIGYVASSDVTDSVKVVARVRDGEVHAP